MRSTDTDTRRGRPGILVALIVAALILTTVYYREGGAGPLHRTRSAMLAVTSPVATAGTWLMSPLAAAGRFVSNLGASRAELETLRKQNVELRDRVTDLEEARQENLRLKGLVAFSQAQDLKTLGARVIGRPTDSWEGVLTLDRGTSDGVRIGMPVVAGRGLIGSIVAVTAHDSRVQLITDQRSGVAIIVQRTRTSGIVRGSAEGLMTLAFPQGAAIVRRGDVVITSGLGGVYPKGLVVGDVSSVATATAGMFPEIGVTSRVPINDIEEALVLLVPATAAEGGQGE